MHDLSETTMRMLKTIESSMDEISSASMDLQRRNEDLLASVENGDLPEQFKRFLVELIEQSDKVIGSSLLVNVRVQQAVEWLRTSIGLLDDMIPPEAKG